MSTLVTTALRHNASSSNNVILTSGGDVGIGTATPGGGARLDVVGGYIRDRFADGSMARLTLENSNRIWTVSNYGTQFGPNGSFTIADETVGVVRMQIDTSGRVTMPAQPIFQGFPTTDYSSGSMPTGVIAFTATHNNGGHYNASTSRFTAPVAGWYRTTWGGLQLGNTVTSLQINGSRTHNGNHFVSGAQYVNMTQTAIRLLNAGDFLTIEGWNGGGYYSSWYLWTVELVA